VLNKNLLKTSVTLWQNCFLNRTLKKSILVLILGTEVNMPWKENTQLHKSGTCVQQNRGDHTPCAFSPDYIFDTCHSVWRWP